MTMPLATFHKQISSPIGPLRLVATNEALTGVFFPSHDAARWRGAAAVDEHPVIDAAAVELEHYFGARTREFTTPLAMHGTAFQRSVWTALLDIPFGETRTYGELAQVIGRPTAARAVGAANGQNPLSIFVPCHRVVGASGALTGYAGGVDLKQWLLDHEA